MEGAVEGIEEGLGREDQGNIFWDLDEELALLVDA